jgi:phytoene desaturase
MASEYDVIIVGSGIGGLTCASLLAKEGLKALVLERLNRVGGCCSNYDVNGFQPEVGAVVVMGGTVYHKLFELLDRRLEDYLELKPLDPVYHFHFLDGSSFSLPKEIEEMAEVISTLSPPDVRNFYRLCADMKKVHDYYRACLDHRFPELRHVRSFPSLVKMAANDKLMSALPILLRLSLGNAERVYRRYFEDPRIQFMFGWESLYAGLPPNRVNGIDAMATYIGRKGYYYPKGGMRNVSLALKRIAEENGAEVRLNSEVERIVMRNGEAKGVKLADGEIVTSRSVVSNAHSRRTYLNLVGQENLPGWAVRTVRRQPCSMPAPVVHLGLKERIQSVRAHLSLAGSGKRQYDALWTDCYDQGLLYRSAEGFYIVIDPSVTDPSLAPAGKQLLSVIYIAPYRLRHHDWDQVAEDWAWEIVSVLDRCAFPGLGSRVEWMDSVSPKEFERRLNLPEGAFLGLELSETNMGPFRPSYRSRLLRRLYLTGQCTNPGGGIPMVMLSGIMTASVLMHDWTEGR